MKSLHFLGETLLFILAVLAFGASQGNPAFIGDAAHPFYLIALLITARYGYIKGMIATVLLGATSFGFEMAGGIASSSGTDLWQSLQQPLSFFAFTMFTGLLLEIDKKKLRVSKEDLSQNKKKIAEKTLEIGKILSVNETLSHQLSTSDQSFNLIFHKTKTMFDEDLQALYQSVHGLLVQTVKASTAYLFLLEGTEFKLAYPLEGQEEATALLQSNPDSIEKIKQMRSYFRIDDTPFPSKSTPIFMGPLMHKTSNKLYGLLVVSELDLIHYTENNYLTFKNLCRWMSEILSFRAHQKEAHPTRAQQGQGFNYLVPFGAPRSIIRLRITQLLSDS